MKILKSLRKIEITPAFLVFLCAYYYFDPAQTFAPFLLSVSLHEAGHLFVMAILGAKVHKLRLGACGASIETAPLSYRHELLIAAAGPIINFSLLLFFLRREPVTALVNFCLLCYNLLPFYPLDGGRILRSLLRLLLGDRTARVMERLICVLCLILVTGGACYLTCVWHAGLWPVLLCGLLILRLGETIFPKYQFFQVRS